MGREVKFEMGSRKVELVTKSYIFAAIRLRKVPKREKWTYGWKRVLFPSKNHIEELNSNNFIEWIINQLKSTGIEVESTNQYNATSLYMNTHDLERLHKYLPSMVWLNYSPTTCDELKNGELGVELSRVKVEKL